MLRLSRWVAVVAILLSASTVAFAQRPAGGQPGGGRPGGFGGGFGGPGGGGPLSLVTNEAVQKELALKEEQIGKFKTLNDEYREEMRSAFSGGAGFGGGQNLSDEERTKQRDKFAESMKKATEKFQPKVNEILDAAQRDRLKQIQLQWSGPQAFQNAEVVAALKLSKDQQEKLASITKEFGEKQTALFPRGGQAGGGGERPNFEEMQKKMGELTAARDKELAGVLTADQTAQLEKLKGKEFARPAFGGFGGGRGGPGGAGGAGGANPGGRPTRRPAEGDKKAETKKEDSK